MVWVRLDDAFGEHPKIAQLSNDALALWVTSLGYCNRNLTDGYIPSAVGIGQLRYCDGNTVPAINELEKAGLWEKVPDGWCVHDFPDYQPTKAQVIAEREAARERKVKSRVKSQGKSRVKSQGKSRRDTAVSHDGVTLLPVPVPVPLLQQQVQLHSSEIAARNFNDEDFNEWWSVYPRRQGKGEAKKAFTKALTKTTAEALTEAAEAYRDDPNREPGFTAMPATWLNQERWGDGPVPSRSATSGAARTLALSRRLEEQEEQT